MEAVECGAASLAMVLAFHGRRVPLEELRIACGVSRDGSNAAVLLRAARSYGLEAKGFRRELKDMGRTVFPAIVFWNFNHFLVLEGVLDDRYYLNDPAQGPYSITKDEFDQGFTGVVLEFARTSEFTPGGAPPNLVALLRERVRGSENALTFALLAGLALVVPGLALPAFTQVFVDQVLVHNLRDWLRPLLLGMGLTAVVRAALGWLQHYYLLRLDTKLSISSSSRFLSHLLRLPVEFYAQRYSGEISSRVAINDTISEFVSRKLASTAIDALLVVFYAALMLAYDPLLTLFGVLAVAVLAGSTVVVNRRRVDGNRRVLQEAGKSTGTLMAGLSAIETLKAGASESDVFARWAGYQAKYLMAQQSLARVTQSFLVVPAFTITMTNAIVLTFGAYRVIEGDLTIGMLVAFQSLMASFLQPVASFVQLASSVQEMHGNMERVQDVLEYPADSRIGLTAAEDQEGAEDRLEGAFELRSVTFGYSRQAAPLLKNFDLRMRSGRRVALVGPSGCGKSTVARLATGLYDPWEGDVLFDGKARTAWPRRVLANSVALVDQEISLFAGTIRENLTLWDSTVPEAVLMQACRDASIHDDIMSRPGAYESQVEEAGANFSGGQRQRLEIARALVLSPRLLVLDEATSALDSVTEHKIDRSLRRRGCTCVIIAHRLSTIRDADEIVVLKEGAVVQRGTHDTLMRDPDGLYATLARES